jgi:diguanylate cyclase (GGDEF)-like protein
VELRERAWIQGGEVLQMTILRDLSAELAAQAHIRHLSDHDPLTGLANRSTFMQRLDELAAQARRQDSPLALLFIDLDHFKRVNDLLGHPAGDVLLRTVAQRLTGCLRSTDLVARFGGDEFMVLLPGRLAVHDVEEVARKLLTVVEQPVRSGDQVFQVTPSIGVALFPQHGDTAPELIKNADTAMYAAKARGRAGIAFYDRDMGSEAGSVLLIESQLTQALARGELRMHLQPQVDARTGAPLGAEALIRWRHPQRGWVPPDAFVPVAEQQRLIVPIGEWMLREAVRAIRRGADDGAPLGVIGVNLSTAHFEAPGFVEYVERVLRDAGVAGDRLELELTERMLIDDLPRVRERLQRLRAMGVRIAVDDFGTGYSSLGHLQQLPVDTLKIDRLFVQDLPDNATSGAILRAIVQMAHSLRIAVLVEGVETDAQRAFLAAEGVDALQGHVISPPLALADYEGWLREQAGAPGRGQPSR